MTTNDELRGRIEAALRADPHRLALEAEETPDCLDPETLVRLAAEGLDDTEDAQAWRHAAGCARCLLGLEAALEEEAQEVPGPLPESTPRQSPRRLGLWIGGALLAAAALTLAILIPPGSTPGPGATFEWAPALASVEPIPIRVTRGADSSALGRATAAYGEYRWADVVAIAEEATAPDDELRLLHGSALLLLDRPREALDVLEPIAAIDSALAREATWACVQAELLLEAPVEAEARLRPLAESAGARYGDASAQLRSLEERLAAPDSAKRG